MSSDTRAPQAPHRWDDAARQAMLATPLAGVAGRPVRKIVTGPLPATQAALADQRDADASSLGHAIVVPDLVLNRIVCNAGRILQIDRCSLALFDVRAGELVTVAALSTPHGALRGSRFRPGEGIAGEVARTREPVLVADVTLDRRFKRLGDDTIRSLICAPLIDGDAVLGAMTASSAAPNAFTANQLELFSIFADQAALAIGQARRAEEVDRLKSAFLSTVSHELRTPLSSIRGFVEIILAGRTGPLTPVQQDFLESVVVSSKHLHRLVDDIMQLSLAEAGQLRLDCAPADLAQLVLSVARLQRPQADAAGVTLEVDLPPSLPPVECDAARIEQVIANLVGNAIKFTPCGGQIALSAGANEIGPWVSVRDTGPGIAAGEQERIFERLYQVQHGLNRDHGGAGLGLAIARHLVDEHGGRIDLVSTPGQGTTFTVHLPWRPAPAGPWRRGS